MDHRILPTMPKEGQPIGEELGLHCRKCGYELTGLVVHRCPECGEALDPRELWLEQERSTWKFHFENIRTKKTYALYSVMLLLATIYCLIGCSVPSARFALLFVAIYELFIIQAQVRPQPVRIAYLIVCVIWALFVACWSNPF